MLKHPCSKIEKYLRTRGISSPWKISGNSRADFSAALVIPALAEYSHLLQALESLARNPPEFLARTLIIVVVNNRSVASNLEKADNLQTLVWLNSNSCPGLNLAWVDAVNPGLEIPAKEGVGLVRKIGFDLALSRLDPTGDSLLISLDADCLVDENYLPAIFQHFHTSRCAGAYLPFRHQKAASAAQEESIRRYELYLRSYVFGLQHAGSPYAYHAVGSALACTVAGYVRVGGMNRRQAAEDFYFLQQLAKSGGVARLAGTIVRPSSRFSDRVPFGTGRVVEAQVVRKTVLYKLCSVDAFQVLKDWLSLVEENWQLPSEVLLAAAGEIDQGLLQFLEKLNFGTVWQKLQQQHGAKHSLLQAFHGWFDGLRTRQLLGCWAAELSSRQQLQAVRDLLCWGGHPGPDGLAGQLALLEQQQL